ncbi:MAG: hypothetical protein AB7U98_15160 [Candidatus Nitrosocosmicus sp.]
MTAGHIINFKDVLKFNNLVFKNVDIRALICRKAEIDPWKIGLIKILPTNRDKEDLKSEYKRILEELKPEKNTMCELRSECISYYKLSSFIDDLESGEFSLDGKTITCNFDTNFRESSLTNYGTSYVEHSDYEDHWSMSILFSKYAEYGVQSLGFDENKINIKFSSLRKWFDISKKDWENHFLHLIMIIPIQIKRIHKPALEEVRRIEYQVNRVFIDDIEILMTLDSESRGIINLRKNKGFKLTFVEQKLYHIMTVDLDDSVPSDIKGIEVSFKSLVLNKEILSDYIDLQINQNNQTDTLDLDEYFKDIHSTNNQINMPTYYIDTMGDKIIGNTNSNITTRPVNSPINIIATNHGSDLSKLVQELVNEIAKVQSENAAQLNILKDDLLLELSKRDPDTKKTKSLLDSISQFGPFVNFASQIMSLLSKSG